MLESKGHEVQEAADGQEGLDLIISDALMPVVDDPLLEE